MAARRYARCLQKLNFNVRLKNFRVVNVLGTCHMPWDIKIVNFSERYKKEASYEPELHPGVTYKLYTPKATLKIFSTGSITVTGKCLGKGITEHYFGSTFYVLTYSNRRLLYSAVAAASVSFVQLAIEHIFPLLYEFRKIRVPREPVPAISKDKVLEADEEEEIMDDDAMALIEDEGDLFDVQNAIEKEDQDLVAVDGADSDQIDDDDTDDSGDDFEVVGDDIECVPPTKAKRSRHEHSSGKKQEQQQKGYQRRKQSLTTRNLNANKRQRKPQVLRDASGVTYSSTAEMKRSLFGTVRGSSSTNKSGASSSTGMANNIKSSSNISNSKLLAAAAANRRKRPFGKAANDPREDIMMVSDDDEE